MPRVGMGCIVAPAPIREAEEARRIRLPSGYGFAVVECPDERGVGVGSSSPDPGSASIEIERAVLRMVCYFDIFRHPLTRAELVRLVAPGEDAKVERAIRRLAVKGQVFRQGEWCFRPGQGHQVLRRRERAARAEHRWTQARVAAGVLARLPEVRGVLVTGGLSKGSVGEHDDIDFMLLVTPGRVWTLKSLLQGARKLAPASLREHACTNYLLGTDHLLIDDRNVFTAVELATAVPMHGPQACEALLAQNGWARRFVPGLDWALQRARQCAPMPARTWATGLEGRLQGAAGARIEATCMSFWNRYWNRRYNWLPDSIRSQRFKRRPEIATNHLHDFQGYVLGELSRRLADSGAVERLELARGRVELDP